MKKFKLILYVIILLLIFGSGYYIGSKKVGLVEEKIIKDEILNGGKDSWP